MTPECRKTIKKLIKRFNYKCKIDTFEYYPGLNWTYISSYRYLSDEFIIQFQNQVDWSWISIRQILSEEFMTEFQHKLDWWAISTFQKLSEKFITKFQHKVDWRKISQVQTLSEKFITQFQHKIDWNMLIKWNKRININDFSNIFFIEFAEQIKNFGNKKQKIIAKNMLKHTVDRTYDIIL